MLKIDMWYGDKLSDVDNIDGSWSDLDLIYRGNLYKNNRIIGDYSCKNITELFDKLNSLAVK